MKALENCSASTSMQGSMNGLEMSIAATSAALSCFAVFVRLQSFVDGAYSHSTANELPFEIDTSPYLSPLRDDYLLSREDDDCKHWYCSPSLGTRHPNPTADGSTNDIPETHLGDTGSRSTSAITHKHRISERYTVRTRNPYNVASTGICVSGEKPGKNEIPKLLVLSGGVGSSEYINRKLTERYGLRRLREKSRPLASVAFWRPNSINADCDIGDRGSRMNGVLSPLRILDEGSPMNQVLFLPYSLWQKRYAPGWPGRHRCHADCANRRSKAVRMRSSPVHFIVRHRARSRNRESWRPFTSPG
jgi:hypothetical protein